MPGVRKTSLTHVAEDASTQAMAAAAAALPGPLLTAAAERAGGWVVSSAGGRGVGTHCPGKGAPRWWRAPPATAARPGGRVAGPGRAGRRPAEQAGFRRGRAIPHPAGARPPRPPSRPLGSIAAGGTWRRSGRWSGPARGRRLRQRTARWRSATAGPPWPAWPTGPAASRLRSPPQPGPGCWEALASGWEAQNMRSQRSEWSAASRTRPTDPRLHPSRQGGGLGQKRVVESFACFEEDGKHALNASGAAGCPDPSATRTVFLRGREPGRRAQRGSRNREKEKECRTERAQDREALPATLRVMKGIARSKGARATGRRGRWRAWRGQDTDVDGASSNVDGHCSRGSCSNASSLRKRCEGQSNSSGG